MKFYQALDVDEETPVQWLAVHPLRWKTAEWGEPAIMFREVDDETQALADAAPDLLVSCKDAMAEIAIMDVSSLPRYDQEHYLKAIHILSTAYKAVADTGD